MAEIDARSLELLEFDRVLQGVAKQAATPMGQERVLSLRPSTELAEAQKGQQLTTQMRRLLEAGGEAARIPLDIPDVRELVRRASVGGGDLTGPELVQVAAAAEELTRLGRHLQRWAAGERALAPALAPWVSRLPDGTPLVRLIRQAVDEDGSVRDTASEELSAIRARLRRAQARVQEALQALIHSPAGRRALQEPIVTLRAGRYVVPVRQECREWVPGIVHDASASGATLFVEPFSVVEANNAVRTEQAREAEEVERILRELSREVGRRSAELLQALEAAGELDAMAARARYSLENRCVEPSLNDQGRVQLRGARHPLLAGPVVPIDIGVGVGFTVLVITGPNMGGKTVALKTVGLLCAMAASGLHIPAEPGSEVAVFREIWVDVGDHQSVTDNLSTFSAHLRRILPVLERADPWTLVLLDELGAGTDPEEGAALAAAILDHLRRRGARVVVTTHLGDLKLMAYRVPGMANASVTFDVERLAPTYRLVVGAPGPSQALAIAGRLGLPPAILEDARARLGQGRWTAEAVIGQLQTELDQTRRRLEEASRARDEAECMRRRARQTLEEVEARRLRVVEQAREQAAELLRHLRREVEALLEQAKAAAARAELEELRRLRASVSALRERVESDLALLADGPGGGSASWSADAMAPGGLPAALEGRPAGWPDPARSEAEPVSLDFWRVPGQVQVGESVWVGPLGRYGTVESAPDEQDQVWVRVGAVRTRVPRRALRMAGPPGTEVEPARGGAGAPGQHPRQALQRAAELSAELDLRGLTSDEAIARLEKYLDDCLLAGVTRVRVIHGHGTGALRQAVRSYLQGCRVVKRFAPAPAHQGGDGATVVELE